MDRGALARRSAFIAAALAVAVAPVSCSGSSDSSNPNDGGPTAEGGGDGDVPEGGVDGSTPTCLDLTILVLTSMRPMAVSTTRSGL